MSGIRSLRRAKTSLGYATGTSTPIYVDSDDNKVKVIPAGSGTTEVEIIDASTTQTLTNKTLTTPVLTNPKVSGVTPISVTGSSVTLGTTHVGRITTLNRAAGIAVTLPAATGSGDAYTLVIGTTFTGAATVAVASATDYMVGTAILFQDAGATVVGFATDNTGTVATESDTLSLFGVALSNGGVKGAIVRLVDMAAAVWFVEYVSDAGGTEATPFSVAV